VLLLLLLLLLLRSFGLLALLLIAAAHSTTHSNRHGSRHRFHRQHRVSIRYVGRLRATVAHNAKRTEALFKLGRREGTVRFDPLHSPTVRCKHLHLLHRVSPTRQLNVDSRRMQRFRLERHVRASELAPSRNFDDEDESALPLRASDRALDDDERESEPFAASCALAAPLRRAVRLLLVAHSDAVRDAVRRMFPLRSLASVARLALSAELAASPVYALSDDVLLCMLAHHVARDDAAVAARTLCDALAPERVLLVDALGFDDRAAALLPARDRSALFFVETPAFAKLADRPALAQHATLLAAFVSYAALRQRPAALRVVDAAVDGDTSHAMQSVARVLATVLPPAVLDVTRCEAELANPTPTFNPMYL
jgi:hypothetical protein